MAIDFNPRNWGKKAVKATGNFLYDVTGADNYMQAYRDARKGNWGGAAFNLAQGLGETGLLVAPGFGTAGAVGRVAARLPKTVKVASALTGIGGRGGARGVATGVAAQAAWRAAPAAAMRIPAVQRLIGPTNQGPRTLGLTADMMQRRLGGTTPVSRTPQTTNPRTLGLTADMMERNIARTGSPFGAARPTPAVDGQPVVGGGAAMVPAEGGGYTVIPGQGAGGGSIDQYLQAGLGTPTVGAGGAPRYSNELAALDPDQMEELLQAARDEERRYQELLNQIGRETSESEREFYDLQRGVGREVAGGRQTTSSALAQLGLDTSPATAAYSEYLGATGQRRIARGRENLAKTLASLRERRGTGEARKLAALREIDRATRRARVQNTMRQAGRYF